MSDVATLGRAGDVVNVKDGFGRNYLIPQGLAVRADPKNLKMLGHLKKMAEAKAGRELKEAEALASALQTLILTFVRASSEDGRLFGSVTNQDISEELRKAGIEIDRRKIFLKEPIKHLGDHEVMVKVGLERQVRLKVSVVREEKGE